MDSITVNDARFDLCRAVEADLPALVELLADDPLGQAREATTLEPYRAAFREIDADDHQLLLVVRSETTAIVGTMQLTLIPGLARGGAKRLLIEAVRLAANVRGGGLGGALFDWAHWYGRDHGARLAQLTSDKSRTDAHRFYRGLGYEPSHEGFKRPL